MLEQQENWYRVRYGSDVEGWMEGSTVLTNDTRGRIQKLGRANPSTWNLKTPAFFEAGRESSG